MNGPHIEKEDWPRWIPLPKGARRWCKRCGKVSILRKQGRQFCGGCTHPNSPTFKRWKKNGCKEVY